MLITKKILKDIETMNVMDQIRIDMIRRREDAEKVNAISRLYLQARKRVRYDFIQDHIRQ